MVKRSPIKNTGNAPPHDHSVDAAIWSKIYSQARAITWLKWVSFSSWDYATMNIEAKRLVAQWIPMETAINQVVSEYLDKSPQYQLALAKAKKDATPKSSWNKSSSTNSNWVYKETQNYTKNWVTVAVDIQKGSWNKTVLWKPFDITWWAEAWNVSTKPTAWGLSSLKFK